MQRVPDDDLRAMLVELYQEDAEFREALDEGLESGLAGQAVASDRTEVGREEVVAETTVETLGLVRQKRELRQAKELLKQSGVTAVVFGHTHSAVDGNAADAPVSAYFNTGTWTPSFDLRSKKPASTARGGLPGGSAERPGCVHARPELHRGDDGCGCEPGGVEGVVAAFLAPPPQRAATSADPPRRLPRGRWPLGTA